MHVNPQLALGATALVTALFGQNPTNDYERTKGIFLDGVRTRPAASSKKTSKGKTNAPAESASVTRAGVKYSVKLIRDGKEGTVPSAYRFLDDDRFQLQFELNSPCYVYVLHRTAVGPPDQISKSVEFESAKDAPKPNSYTLLFPRGKARQMPAGKDQLIPDEGVLRMDKKPGLEKLFVVISPDPLDLSKYFDPESAHGYPSSDDAEAAQLTRELATMGENAQVAESKGVTFEGTDSFGVSRDPRKPMVVVVNLGHYHREAQ